MKKTSIISLVLSSLLFGNQGSNFKISYHNNPDFISLLATEKMAIQLLIDTDSELGQKILAVGGVRSVVINPHEISIWKYEKFDWRKDGILDKVSKIVKRHLRNEGPAKMTKKAKELRERMKKEDGGGRHSF